ncbi:MAG: ABC transporter ATP-binding protein [bacterium]|nr:ABC transporter ATP-binding protein [bacterium]
MVVDDLAFTIERGETLCLVGESGCGKTITALSLLKLPPRGARIVAGEMIFRGRDLTGMSEKEMRDIRGGEIAMIFQEPMTSLNPLLRVGDQVGESLRRHRRMSGAAARSAVLDLFAEVGIPDPAQRLNSFPHELSGGLRQRVMIAMALACGPALLIADEPTTALDVTIQAQILRRLTHLRTSRNLAILLITHDLGVVAEVGSRVLVMYAGQVVESASVPDLFDTPLHPYTRGLLASLPRVDRDVGRLTGIPGTVPQPGAVPSGCRFRPRCTEAGPGCDATQHLAGVGDGRAVRCCRTESP